MTNTPLEPVKGSWDVEITKDPSKEYSLEALAKINEFATELAQNVNLIEQDEETVIPEGITVITLRKI